jgi:hypothetical protein
MERESENEPSADHEGNLIYFLIVYVNIIVLIERDSEQ